ncbi:MAG: YqgE/AlgH family protein [Bacteroidales bacterium]|nr:YqgE/AlgH family protein [Bacteroidales bacterium]
MDLDYNFFDAESHVKPQKGKVLISEPFLQDNYFKRSIVLLTEHTEEGSIGFVLNKPVNIKVTEVIKDFPEFEATVSLGGPVNTNTIHYIHTLGDIIPESIHVHGNVFWGGDFEAVKRLIKSGNLSAEQIRFFLGYSGWSSHQLEDELEENAWVVTEINLDNIMSPMNKNFWKKTLQKMGKKYELWSQFPENPQMN